MDKGGCQSLMVDNLVGSMHLRSCLIIMLRYSMVGVSKELWRSWEKVHVLEGVKEHDECVGGVAWDLLWCECLNRPYRSWAIVLRSCWWRYGSWMPGKLVEHCRNQRTWQWAQRGWMGWWMQPSIGLLLKCECCYNPIGCQTWWTMWNLSYHWLTQEWGGEGIHCEWCGYWDSGNPDMVRGFHPFWVQRRRVRLVGT